MGGADGGGFGGGRGCDSTVNDVFMYGATESLEETQRMAERPTTSDATRKLHAFRPIAESVATLKSLLEERADPNGMKPLPPGHIIPLQNVSLEMSKRYVQ